MWQPGTLVHFFVLMHFCEKHQREIPQHSSHTSASTRTRWCPSLLRPPRHKWPAARESPHCSSCWPESPSDIVSLSQTAAQQLEKAAELGWHQYTFLSAAALIVNDNRIISWRYQQPALRLKAIWTLDKCVLKPFMSVNPLCHMSRLLKQLVIVYKNSPRGTIFLLDWIYMHLEKKRGGNLNTTLWDWGRRGRKQEEWRGKWWTPSDVCLKWIRSTRQRARGGRQNEDERAGKSRRGCGNDYEKTRGERKEKEPGTMMKK